jgi:hypothetical protein
MDSISGSLRALICPRDYAPSLSFPTYLASTNPSDLTVLTRAVPGGPGR